MARSTTSIGSWSGGFPNPDTADDPDLTYLDMWSEWVNFGRGETFNFAALTHARDREIGCAYLYLPRDGDDPYEAGLHIWTIEDAVRDDSDLALLREFLAWIEAEWAFNSLVYYTPESYQRGLDNAEALGLRRVDRERPQPEDACFQWVRP
jgi:hypothetical protein